MVFSAISHVCNLISEIYMHLHENYAKKNPMLDLDPYFFSCQRPLTRFQFNCFTFYTYISAKYVSVM